MSNVQEFLFKIKWSMGKFKVHKEIILERFLMERCMGAENSYGTMVLITVEILKIIAEMVLGFQNMKKVMSMRKVEPING